MQEYKESQKFNQWWLWILFLALFAGLSLNGIDIFEKTESLLAFLGPGIVAIMMILFALVELRTTITEDGIEAKFWPFGGRRIFRSEIVSAEVRKYSPIREFGGWGYRIGPKGKAFNMYGRQGLELKLTNGETFMLGTQRPEELRTFMEWYLADGEEVLTDEMVSLKLKELRLDELEP